MEKHRLQPLICEIESSKERYFQDVQATQSVSSKCLRHSGYERSKTEDYYNRVFTKECAHNQKCGNYWYVTPLLITPFSRLGVNLANSSLINIHNTSTSI